MTTPAPLPDGAEDDKRMAAAPAESDPVAVTPAIGPIPAIYIPRSSNKAGAADQFWFAAVRAARKAARWATRCLSHHRADPRR
ncbi:hypothetical protein AB0C70_25135 [Streptomyces sp. NPDC048564]|uniref:hypothetical protein n=1 Tax=Streptomyces sp. NPDC048564 TaxID=3155760 RepID=UPI00342BB8ED